MLFFSRSFFTASVFASSDDVTLLGKATLSYFSALLDEIGVHPVSCGKYTVASFSFNAVQMFLYRSKRYALYCPDWKPLYHAIRKSCLGGLSMVTRHDCMPGSSSLNAHLNDSWNNSPKSLHYLDENSLYASAVSKEQFGFLLR